jgi:hypothetical protein
MIIIIIINLMCNYRLCTVQVTSAGHSSKVSYCWHGSTSYLRERSVQKNLYLYFYELRNHDTTLVKWLDNYRRQIDRTIFVLLSCVPEIYALPNKNCTFIGYLIPYKISLS